MQSFLLRHDLCFQVFTCIYQDVITRDLDLWFEYLTKCVVALEFHHVSQLFLLWTQNCWLGWLKKIKLHLESRTPFRLLVLSNVLLWLNFSFLLQLEDGAKHPSHFVLQHSFIVMLITVAWVHLVNFVDFLTYNYLLIYWKQICSLVILDSHVLLCTHVFIFCSKMKDGKILAEILGSGEVDVVAFWWWNT